MSNNQLDAPYALDETQLRKFREDGFIRLENVLSKETLAEFAPEISRLVEENDPNKDVPLEERSLYDRAFIQVCNLWKMNEQVKRLACCTRLARIAAKLMGTRGVRM